MFHLHIQAWLWSVFCKAGNKVFIKKSFSIFFPGFPHIFVDLWCQGSLWWSFVSIRHCLTTQIAQRNTNPNSQVFTTIKVMIVEIFFKKNTTMSFSSQEVVSVHCVCQTYFFNRYYVCYHYSEVPTSTYPKGQKYLPASTSLWQKVFWFSGYVYWFSHIQFKTNNL